MAELYSNIGTAHRQEGSLREAAPVLSEITVDRSGLNPGEGRYGESAQLGKCLAGTGVSMTMPLNISERRWISPGSIDSLSGRQIPCIDSASPTGTFNRHIEAFHFLDDVFKIS